MRILGELRNQPLMNGSNTLELNRATMNEAIQYWLNATQMKARVEVSEVTFQSSGNGKFYVAFKPEDKAEEVA